MRLSHQKQYDIKKTILIINIDHFSKDRLIKARSIAGYVIFNILEKYSL